MDSDDKPFACSFAGCNQKFITEDKLSMHLQKHELNIEGLTNVLFPDQTPTPTTFLRDCENLGLFQDLGGVKNPFDESFRKAVIDPDSNELVDSDGIETPSIPILPDSAAILGSLNTPTSAIRDLPGLLRLRSTLLTPTTEKSHSYGDNLDTPSVDTCHGSVSPTQAFGNIRKTFVLPHKKDNSSTKVTSENDDSISPSRTVSTVEATSTVSTAKKDSVIPQGECIMSASVQDPAGSSISDIVTVSLPLENTTTPDIVTISLPHVSSTTANADTVSLNTIRSASPKYIDPSNTVLLTQPVETTANRIAIADKPKTVTLVNPQSTQDGGKNVLQTLQTVALLVSAKPAKVAEVNTIPGGKLVPKLMPASIQIPINSVPNTLISQVYQPASLINAAEPELSTHVLAKQRLKQALTKDSGGTQTHSQSSGSQSTISDSETQFMSSSQKRTLSQSDEEQHDTVDEKRLKTLERNRDAARRCRKKKKVFIQGLEEKLKEVMHINAQLLSENSRLKMEVADLKSLFLAHKDCQVTKKQMVEGQLSTLLLNPTQNGITKKTNINSPGTTTDRHKTAT